MTREEAKKLLPIIQAFVEGKSIECKSKSLFGSWAEANCPSWSVNLEYRIKPESKYRPFKTQEECWNEMMKHQPLGWVKNESSNIFNIIAICKDSIRVNEHSMSYSEFYERFTFIDGTPFGIKEE